MKPSVIALALLSTLLHGASNLSITPAEDGSDYLWVSCLDDSDTGFIWRFNGTVNETWRAFAESYHGVSTTITLDPSSGMHLIAAVDNVLYSLDPWDGMATEDSLVFLQDFEWSVPGLLRRTAVPGYGLLSSYMATYFSSGSEFMWLSREYTVSTSGELSTGDSLTLFDPYPLSPSRYPEDLVHNVTFPVMNANGSPVMAQRQALSGSPMPPEPGSWQIAAQCHNTTASSVYLTADTLTWSTTESTEPELLASGSDYYQAVFLWSDSTGTVFYSIHDCMEGFTSTLPFPGQGPARLQAAAMSANPADPGLLLVWQSGGDLYCRHYSDGWNDYAYLLRSGLYPLSPGHIAVCGVEDGYWVAYLEGGPEVFFVDRNDVTGIGSTSSPVEPVAPRIWPNPFSSSLSVGLAGETPVQVELFDGTGRRLAQASGNGTALLDTSDLPCGCYLVRITSGNEVFIEKAVLAR
ncbi:MAG TPA: T9SS type A sorting domain-containing protein [Candidatus Sabulitectum sp.]|nr:T9SS type A sorting domain-containing protein [Candidatus Sabulitectum sp.]